jgi:hypothetical protein
LCNAFEALMLTPVRFRRSVVQSFQGLADFPGQSRLLRKSMADGRSAVKKHTDTKLILLDDFGSLQSMSRQSSDLAVTVAKPISKKREGNWSDMAHSPKKAVLRSTNFAD